MYLKIAAWIERASGSQFAMGSESESEPDSDEPEAAAQSLDEHVEKLAEAFRSRPKLKQVHSLGFPFCLVLRYLQEPIMKNNKNQTIDYHHNAYHVLDVQTATASVFGFPDPAGWAHVLV